MGRVEEEFRVGGGRVMVEKVGELVEEGVGGGGRVKVEEVEAG